MEDSQKYLPPTVNDYHHDEDTQNNTLPSFRDFYEKFKDEYHTKEKVHVSNKHLSGRDFRGKYLTVFCNLYSESSIHNNIMHDCNRHRKNGYKDNTFKAKIVDQTLDHYNAHRDADRDRR